MSDVDIDTRAARSFAAPHRADSGTDAVTLCSTKKWTPLFSGDEADRAWDRVREVQRALSHSHDSFLERGEWGIPLLNVYYALCTKASSIQEEAQKAAELAAEAIEKAERPWLYGQGWAGLSWLIGHLEEVGGYRLFEFDEVHRGLRELLAIRPWGFSYDLVSGVVGVAVALADQIAYTPDAPRGLAEAVELIVELSVPIESGVTWYTPPGLLPEWQRRIAPEGYYNCGVAHGVPGLLWVLGRARYYGIAVNGADECLERGIQWLTKPWQQGPRSLPCWIQPNGESRPGGMSWCYGAIGIALILLSIALDTGNDSWYDLAIEIARNEGERTGNLADAGLCHGAAGIAHLFNRIFQHTEVSEFADFARSWYGRTLDFRAPQGDGIGGYQSWTSEMPRSNAFSWKDDATFLTGASGTALALLAAFTDVEPKWDATLLMPSLRGPSRR